MEEEERQIISPLQRAANDLIVLDTLVPVYILRLVSNLTLKVWLTDMFTDYFNTQLECKSDHLLNSVTYFDLDKHKQLLLESRKFEVLEKRLTKPPHMGFSLVVEKILW